MKDFGKIVMLLQCSSVVHLVCAGARLPCFCGAPARCLCGASAALLDFCTSCALSRPGCLAQRLVQSFARLFRAVTAAALYAVLRAEALRTSGLRWEWNMQLGAPSQLCNGLSWLLGLVV